MNNSKEDFMNGLKTQTISDDTIKCFEKAIWLWEDFTNKADFASFNMTKQRLLRLAKNKKKKNSQENISISYCYDNLRHLKVFLTGYQQAGYKSKKTRRLLIILI